MACTARTLKLGAKKAVREFWDLVLNLAVLAAIILFVFLVISDCALGACLVSDKSLKAIYQLCHGTLLAGSEIPVFVAYLLINSAALLAVGLTLLCAIGASELEAKEAVDSFAVIAETQALLNTAAQANDVANESEPQAIACCALSQQGTLHLARPIAARQEVEEFCSVMGQQFLLICSPEQQAQPQALQTSTLAFSAYQKGLNGASLAEIVPGTNGFNTGDAELNELLSVVLALGAGTATQDMALSLSTKVSAVVTRLGC